MLKVTRILRKRLKTDDSFARETLQLYLHEVLRHKNFFVPLLIAMPLAMFFTTFLTAWVISQAINILTTQTVAPDDIWSVFGPWIAAYIGSIVMGELVLWRLVIFLIWKLETKVVYNLNKQSFETLASQSMAFHNNRFSGSLVSQVNKFSGAYVRIADIFTFNIIPLIFSFIFTFAILGPQMPLYTLTLAGLSAIFMIIAIFSFRSIRSLNVKEAEAQNKLSGQLADSVTNIMAVKSSSAEDAESSRYDQLNRSSQRASLNVLRAIISRDLGFGAVIVLISALGFIFLIGGQAWFGIAVGTLVLAITYSGQILAQLWNFNNILRSTNRAFGDAREMTQILGTARSVTDKPTAKNLSVSTGKIDFNSITYRHADAPKDAPLFKDFSLTIKAGEHVGLVGASGSGKTTLTKLLLRFADINNGEILIDGQNIADVTQTSLRHKIAYVPQEPLLFHRSLRENIAYGRPDSSEKEIIDAAKQAYAWDFINKMPGGLDTTVGERGVKLSGGQRQRIAIARAILKDAPILILDEATSALDSESEKLIQRAFTKLMKGRTSIVIAHRLSTIKQLDKIVVMEDGRIIEFGSHQELLNKKGTYASLWSLQSGGVLE